MAEGRDRARDVGGSRRGRHVCDRSRRARRPAELRHVQRHARHPQRHERSPGGSDLGEHHARAAIGVDRDAVDVARQLRRRPHERRQERRRQREPPDDHAGARVDAIDRAPRRQVQGCVGGRSRRRRPELRVVGLVPDLERVDRLGPAPRMLAPVRPARPVARRERGRICAVGRCRRGRGVVPAGDRLIPQRRVVDDREPPQPVRRQRSRDLVVEPPVVAMHAVHGRGRLAPLPQRVGARYRRARRRQGLQLGVDPRGRVGAVVEQPVDARAELRPRRRRPGRERFRSPRPSRRCRATSGRHQRGRDQAGHHAGASGHRGRSPTQPPRRCGRPEPRAAGAARARPAAGAPASTPGGTRT